MPKKYHIALKAEPPRSYPVGKYATIEFREDCAGSCRECVKKKCVYGIFKDNYKHMSSMDEPIYLYECHSCFQMRSGVHQSHLFAGDQPRIQDSGGSFLARGPHPPPMVPGPHWKSACVRRRVSRTVYRRGVRFHVDGHVGDRPPHPRRHPRARVHQHRNRAVPAGLSASVQSGHDLGVGSPRDSGDPDSHALGKARRSCRRQKYA